MADFSGTIGNGLGCFACLGVIQTNNTLYNSYYKSQTAEQLALGLPGIDQSVQASQGLFENSTTNKKSCLKMMQDFIQRTAPGVYTLNKRFFTNITLTPGVTLGMFLAGDMAGFLAHPDTIELNALDANDIILLEALL